jgi:hypothetical protein
MPYKWTRLIDLLFWLKQHPDYQFLFVDHEEVLRNALRSREVPIRAKERTEFARVELLLSDKSTIDIWLNSITVLDKSTIEIWGTRIPVHPRRLEYVEADANAFEKWLRENAIDRDRVLPDTPQRSTSARAIDNLEQYLSTRPDSPSQIKREFFDALKDGRIPELGNRYKALSGRAFNLIWTEHAPEAWTKGGHRPGRPRKIKSSR